MNAVDELERMAVDHCRTGALVADLVTWVMRDEGHIAESVYATRAVSELTSVLVGFGLTTEQAAYRMRLHGLLPRSGLTSEAPMLLEAHSNDLP